jgi:hypothetical protein
VEESPERGESSYNDSKKLNYFHFLLIIFNYST